MYDELDPLTLQEKTNGAVYRAKMQTAEKHFFDLNQPFYPSGFSITKRDTNHWDIYAPACPGQVAAIEANGGSTSQKDGDRERAFRIRGEPGDVQVSDERWDPNRPNPRGWITFRSIGAAMLYISEELMQEPKP